MEKTYRNWLIFIHKVYQYCDLFERAVRKSSSNQFKATMRIDGQFITSAVRHKQVLINSQIDHFASSVTNLVTLNTKRTKSISFIDLALTKLPNLLALFTQAISVCLLTIYRVGQPAGKE